MPLAINHGNNLRRQFLSKNLSNAATGIPDYSQEKKDRIKKHITRYRRNWDIYVEEVLQIKLYPIQKILIHMMGVSDVFWAICTRGAAKSFLVGIGALCAFSLLPYSEIVITSSTISQAAKMVEKKIRDEIIKKLSPYLLYMYEKEYIVITKSSTDQGAYTVENKLNGSTISVVACLDSSRGIRSTMNIFEEARLLKKSTIDSVFIPMGHQRPTPYLLLPQYKTKRWEEKARQIYITSSRYSWEWFNREFRKCVLSYYTSKHDVYIPFAEDIFAAIDDGARTWSDYRKSKKAMGDSDFECEILNLMLGSTEDSFFGFEQFREAQCLNKCYIPRTQLDIVMEKDVQFPNKAENEFRIISADFAFTETASNGNESDFTQFVCVSGHWKKDRFERHVDYIETWRAGDDEGAVKRLRQMYWEYQADFITTDARNGGENIVLQFSKPDEDKHGEESHGMGMCAKPQYHIAAQDKIEYYRARAIDRDFIPCIIPFVGSTTTNTAYWRSTKRALDKHLLKLPISMQDKQTQIEDDGTYFTMNPDEVASLLVPFGQSDELIHEAVNLQTNFKNDQIQLTAPKGRHRDRIVTLAMAMLIMDRVEEEWNRQEAESEIDLDDFDVIF